MFSFFNRLSVGFGLACSSWQVLRTDKKLIVFPILSGLSCLLVLASFVTPFVVRPQLLNFLDNPQGVQVPPWAYVVTFAFYFCNYFVIVFFNAALISCALVRFNGGEATVGDGLRAAASRLPQIVAWALVSATVGLVLKVVEQAHEKAGEIVSFLLGTAWTVLTYFVVPVLVVEKVGPVAAIQRSMALIRQTWGEAWGGHGGINLFVFLLVLPAVIPFGLGFIMLAQAAAVGMALIGLGIVYVVLCMAVGSALNGIFLGAMYQYAAFGHVPASFEQDVLARVFERKG